MANTTSRTYDATYGGSPCTAITTDGRLFTVILKKDPGYGSMLFTRIYASQVVLLEELIDQL